MNFSLTTAVSINYHLQFNRKSYFQYFLKFTIHFLWSSRIIVLNGGANEIAGLLQSLPDDQPERKTISKNDVVNT